ncbi:DUF2306 domain-containing protein [Aquimarina sp. M1]
MESIAVTFIYIHAIFGGIALLSGLISIIGKKGGFYHKRAGVVFSITMFISASIAIPITLFPSHRNLLLHLLSIFTLYLVVSGNRVLQFKKNHTLGITDILITSIMGLVFIGMISVGIHRCVHEIPKSPLFFFFGGFGIMASIRDISLYKTFKADPKAHLSNHIGKMSGAYGAAVTAFLLAALDYSNLWVWLSPSVITLLFVICWRIKIAKT